MDEQTSKLSRRKTVSSKCEMGGSCCGGMNGFCSCGGNVWRCQHSCHLIRWILGIIILSFVFWGGMKIGELKSEMRGDHFYRQDGFGRAGMMNWELINRTNSDIAPSTTSTKTEGAKKN